MDAVLDAVLEIFTWVGVLGAVLLGVAAGVLWVLDGTWLPVDAVVDRDDDAVWVRWIDADGDVNGVEVHGLDAESLGPRGTVTIWYRYGWRNRMRLTRRSPVLRAVLRSSVALVVLAGVSFAGSIALLLSRA